MTALAACTTLHNHAHVHTYTLTFTTHIHPPKNGKIVLWVVVLKMSIFIILVLPGSSTEITDYMFLSLLETRLELKYKGE